MRCLAKKIFSIILATNYFLLATSYVRAVDLGSALQLGGGQSVAGSDVETLGGIVSVIIPNLLTLAGIIVLILIVAGGVMIVMGGANPQSAERGKTAITGAIIGAGVIFGSYWIVQIIQILTGVPILNAPF